ncbi:MAG: putative 4-hydroxybenzoate polyprenyltransferase [Actinobacteria bacterium]|nr:putative 4-hydroxybenzoate polyprenyltransferase [Actinomycetota bacterium]
MPADAVTNSPLKLPLLFARFVKIEHSVFALPFAYTGAFLAMGDIGGFLTMLWITVVMVGGRSLAMGLNRVIDYEIDARNPRTAGRELPAGTLTLGQGISFCAVSLALLVIGLSQLPALTWYLSPIVVAAFVIYPYTKRFTSLCHVFLGATIGLAPVGAWVAVTGGLSWKPFLLMGVVTLWIGGFDIIYACLDLDFDRREGIHSLPVSIGVGPALWVTRAFHLAAVVLLLEVGVVFSQLGVIYFAGVAVVALLLAYENAIVSPRDLSRVNTAFMTMNGIISVVYIGFVAADLLAG